MTRLRHAVTIERPLPEVYALAQQVERYPDFLPGYLESRIIDKQPGRILLQRKALLNGEIKEWKSWASFIENQSILFEHFEGPLKGMQVVWAFQGVAPLETELVITHKFDLREPGRFRRFIHTMRYKRQIDRLAALVVAAFKEAAEKQTQAFAYTGDSL